MKSASIPEETGAQAHTRRAIIDSAARTLLNDFSASLADIASEAGVGRTTLHRYFNERGDLLAAISATALEQSLAATERARLGEGPALDAVGRFCEEHFEMGDLLMLVLNEPQLTDMAASSEEDTQRAILELIVRGQTDGTIDPRIPPRWAHHLMWSLTYTALRHKRVDGASSHQALSLCLSSLRRALESQPSTAVFPPSITPGRH